ncbi:Hypothetical_protein [Hexamita inflata]|uniref:Hypothetical_protein n=1 Tax=Hexamita inflata TaxID=28002 RepID=A0AA86PMB2_9EUKA|nr:Hypothetical protein HINF_LOCUS28497 [Hexamita inflata]
MQIRSRNQKFSENFWKRCLQLKWKTKSESENIPNWARFALTYRHPGHFLKLLGCLYSNKGGWFNSRLCSNSYFLIFKIIKLIKRLQTEKCKLQKISHLICVLLDIGERKIGFQLANRAI